MFDTYCKNWKLTVIASNPKIIAFGNIRGRVPELKISGRTLEVVDEYKYLGIYLSKTGSSLQLTFQNKPIEPSISLKSKTLGLPSDLQLDLFNKTVKPMLLYGAEVWGIGKLDMCKGSRIEPKDKVKYLGAILEQTLSGVSMVNSILQRANARLKFLYLKQIFLNFHTKKN